MSEKKPSQPMVGSCSPAGTTFDLGWPAGTHQVRARHFNKSRNFESNWSEWRTFTVLGVSGRGE